MAVLSADDFFFTIGGTDLADHLDTIELDRTASELIHTNFDSGGNVERIGGIEDGSIALNFHQDYAASQVEATVWPLFNSLVSIIVKPVDGATSATNPSFTANYLVSQWKPVAGKVGELAVVSLTWNRSGAITRATS